MLSFYRSVTLSPMSIELHVLEDASERAFGAVA